MRRLRALITNMEEPTGVGGWWLIAASLALTVAVPIADAFLPQNIHLAHVLVLPVALVSAVKGPRWGSGAAALAVLSIVIAGAERHTLSTESVLVEISSLVSLSALLVLFGHLHERRQREMARLRRVSEAAQGVVLRALPQRAGPLSIASEYRAAEDGARLGGDLYAVARTDNATRLLIGDVRGRGLSSIGDTETVLSAFRVAAYRKGPLSELVESLEEGFRRSLSDFPDPAAGTDAGERFVTALVVEIPDNQARVHVVSCGHPSPLLLHEGTARLLDVVDPAPPLGLGGLSGRSPGSMYSTTKFDFAPGDLLLLYTDGVTEARNRHGAFYPLVERAGDWPQKSPETLLKALTEDLLAYVSSPPNDDMAVVAVQRHQSGANDSSHRSQARPP